jgi:hypothetical protein
VWVLEHAAASKRASYLVGDEVYRGRARRFAHPEYRRYLAQSPATFEYGLREIVGRKERMAQQASTKKWMRGASTPLRGALLGLLLERPGHGGDLVHRLIARLGDTWRINPDDVYRLLTRLDEEGLAYRARNPGEATTGARAWSITRPTRPRGH